MPLLFSLITLVRTRRCKDLGNSFTWFSCHVHCLVCHQLGVWSTNCDAWRSFFWLRISFRTRKMFILGVGCQPFFNDHERSNTTTVVNRFSRWWGVARWTYCPSLALRLFFPSFRDGPARESFNGFDIRVTSYHYDKQSGLSKTVISAGILWQVCFLRMCTLNRSHQLSGTESRQVEIRKRSQ